jgi:hypothetical protein
MLTALVAYDRLPEARRAELLAILRAHPRYQADFESAMPDGLDQEDQDRWVFAQASIWPDLVRKRNGDGSIPADRAGAHEYLGGRARRAENGGGGGRER